MYGIEGGDLPAEVMGNGDRSASAEIGHDRTVGYHNGSLCGLGPNPNHSLEFSAPTNGPVRSYRYPRDPENPGPALSEKD